MKKILFQLLTLLLCALLLAGCAVNDITETQTVVNVTEPVQTTDAQTEPAPQSTTPETEPQAEEPIEVISIGGISLGDFSIVLAKEPNSTVVNAANDLIRLVKFAEGVELKTVYDDESVDHAIILDVTVRDTEKIKAARDEVKDDGYALIEDGGNLYITGAIPRGTMNGVYDFLQDYMGVRFYSDTFTYVKPEYVKNVPSGQKTVFNPVFGGRYNWSYASEVNVQRFTKRTKSTSIKYAGSHNLGSLSKTGNGTSPQPCLSDPQVFETVLENLCKQIEKKPTKTFFHINQNDGGAFCGCAECKAKNEAAGGTAMGSLLMFINDIADAVKEKYPDREIDILTYAYKETTVAPDPEVVKPRDNVIIVLCMMDSSCFTHAFSDPECEMNSVSYANMVKWSEMCDKFCVYDYSYNHASQITSVGPNLDVLWDNMQTYKECGCIGLLMEGDHVAETGEFAELRNYLINRLLWDPNITKDEYYKLWDEFMVDYYGEAAPYIREYIDLVNATSLRKGLTAWNGHTSVYTDPTVFFAPTVDGKKDYTVINKCAELWDTALECTLTDEQFAHVEKSSLHFRDFQSRFAKTSVEKRDAKAAFEALCDKYTYNYDAKLPPLGKTDGIDTDKPSDGLEFRVSPDKTVYVSDIGEFGDGVLVIPTEYEGQSVTKIGKSAFARATCVSELYVPEGIEYIGVYAFRGCENLKAVHLPASVKTLGYGAFGIKGDEHYGCAKLTDIYYAGTFDAWAELYGEFNGVKNALEGCTVHCSDGDITL